MSPWETDCRFWGFVGSRNFFPSLVSQTHAYKETQCEAKRLFSQQTSPFVYVQPGVILDAFWRGFFFSLKRLMKELTITLAAMLASDEIWVYVICSSKAGKEKPAETEGGDITPLATVSLFSFFFFVLNPRGGMEEMSFAVDIWWIPHRVNDIMQRFLNKFYPAWGEKRAIRPSTCRLQQQGRREDEARIRACLIPVSNSGDGWVCAFYATDLLQLKNNN